MFFVQLLTITLAIVAMMAFISRPMHYIKLMAKCLGFGFLVYHSDSGKYFYALTRKDAMEWLGATYADAAVFSNRTKEALFVKLVKA